ncbi:Hsp20/alpha crystallin family protein [Coralloluteibacterium thermophilus]|uniref:Hsp20/alpha crystallin family protein n=1 Tax=Coralloluteibacterium thermophilum TaxID=2707049 RepID=A0ABV9NJU0_9GAMM
MSLTQYNPKALRNPLQDEFNKVLERFLGDNDQSSVVTAQWAPRVDIKEESERFVIFADIPGVDPKDIEVHMEDGVLTIKGERKAESAEENGNGRYSRMERSHGLFYRRFALPDSADPDGITASGRNGVLQVVIPKRPETKPRRIEVQ